MIARGFYPVRDRQAYCLYIQRPRRGRRIQTIFGVNPEPHFYESEDKIKNNNNKTKLVCIRFRESDYDAIKKKAEQSNMNFTEFVTAAAMNKSVTVINGLEDVLKEQKAIGRNLNQLTTLCNMGNIVCPDLRELKQQYADMMSSLNEIIRRRG